MVLKEMWLEVGIQVLLVLLVLEDILEPQVRAFKVLPVQLGLVEEILVQLVQLAQQAQPDSA
jgi:hypothetical protein